MKQLFPLLLAVLFSQNAFSQSDSVDIITHVPFVSYWWVGDTYNFKVTKMKKKWKDGQLTKSDSSGYIAKFTVIDSTETTFKIKWEYKACLGTDWGLSEEMMEKLSKYDDLTEVIYATNEVGEFIGVENWQAISEMTTSIFNSLMEETTKEKDMDKEAFDKMMQPLISIYSSKDAIEQLVLKELQYFHFPFGVEYPILDTVEYEEEMQNMFGGEPFKGEAILYFEEVDLEDDFCILVKEMQIEPESTHRILSDFFKTLGMKDDELDGFIKSAVFDIRDFNPLRLLLLPRHPHFN